MHNPRNCFGLNQWRHFLFLGLAKYTLSRTAHVAQKHATSDVMATSLVPLFSRVVSLTSGTEVSIKEIEDISEMILTTTIVR